MAIARTLAYQPQVLLFDEPFGALDAQTRVRLRREIRGLLREVNVPAVFVTRPKPEASAAPLQVGDRVALGLTTFRVLPNFALASERGGQIIDTGSRQ